MFSHYLKTSLRNLRRHKGYSFINVAGLAVGITCCLFLGLYLKDELSFDRYHEKADQIYRITLEETGEGQSVHWARTQPALAPALETDFPEMLQAVRLAPQGTTPVRVEDERFQEEAFCYVEAAFFEVFSYTFLHGNPKINLIAPETAVLTRSAAQRYFGEVNVLGKTFALSTARGESVVEVIAVVEDMPTTSHFHCDILASLTTLTAAAPPSFDFDNRWNLIGVYTYVLLSGENNDPSLADQLPAFARRHVPERNFQFHLQPLSRIHLYSHLEAELEPNGHISYIYVFGTMALLILLIACINFINLATARSVTRAKEVGVRKVVGAHRWQLASQFLAESMLFAVLAGLLAGVLAWISLPLFNQLSGKVLTVQDVGLEFGAMLLGIVLLIGLFAGSYPAFVLSAFRPVITLKGNRGSGRGDLLRKGLVVLQFTICIALVAGTFVIYNQLRYMKQKPLGFEKEHIVVLPNLRAVQPTYDLETIKQELRQHNGIRSVAAARYAPTRVPPNFNPVFAEGRSEETLVLLHPVDTDYVEALGLNVVEGRNFSRTFASDSSAIIINEAAAHRFGWIESVGKEITEGTIKGHVIGVVKDFHYQSLHQAIEPSVFFFPNTSRSFRELIIRLNPGNVSGALTFLEAKWKTFAPEEPFDYFFLDESYNALYQAENRLRQLIGTFAGIAVIIACLGLFGLAAFTAEQRTKEIGIRKVMGASIASIVFLLSKDVLQLVLIAILIATPLAYFMMSRWLESYAYRINMGVDTFLVAGILAVTIALLTVSYQAVKAASANPVNVLRYE